MQQRHTLRLINRTAADTESTFDAEAHEGQQWRQWTGCDGVLCKHECSFASLTNGQFLH